MSSIEYFFGEGPGHALLSPYELAQAQRTWCAYAIKTLVACKSIDEAVDVFQKMKQYHINKIEEYDIRDALNDVLNTTDGIKRFVKKIEASVGQVPHLLRKYQTEVDRCKNQKKIEYEIGLTHYKKFWENLTRTMGHAHPFPTSFFFQVDAQLFCENMYGCEGEMFRRIYEQLNADSIMLNIFQFVCDCSLYIPREALQDDGEHMVQCSFCYKARMGERIMKTNNPVMCQLWRDMTYTPCEPQNIPCTRKRKYDDLYGGLLFSPFSPFSPLSPPSPAYEEK
jgi:hypothetical protein